MNNAKHNGRVLMAGGGTAGHVLPAIAVAEALVESGCPQEAMHFVGSKRGLEARLVPAKGFSITLLPGRGIQRRVNFANVVSAAGLGIAFIQALKSMISHRPKVVVSFGGYAALPCVVAAGILRVPLILVESTAVAGAANRVGARFARASAVAFEGVKLPNPAITGNPVRKEIVDADRSDPTRKAARTVLGIPEDRTLITASGGSLGSRRINSAVIELAERWKGRDDIAIRHVIGKRDWESLQSSLLRAEDNGLIYQPVEYDDRMEVMYTASDLAISRAGGTSVAELAVLGLPAIFVPLPNSPGNHQMLNAQKTAQSGGALVLDDAECTGEKLEGLIDSLLAEAGKLAKMSSAMKSSGHPDAAQRIAKMVEEHAGSAWGSP